MALEEIRQSTFGDILRSHIKDQTGAIVDLSTYDTFAFTFRKPNGVSIAKTATVYSAESGILQYVIESGLLDLQGLWRYQSTVQNGITEVYKSSIVTFKVYPNL